MIQKPATVRPATPRDERGVFNILKLAHQENAYDPLSERKVVEAILRCTRPNPERGYGIIGIVVGPKEIEGIIMMVLTNWWYSDAWHLEEFCNFVHPDYRRSNHAKDLIQFGKYASQMLTLPLHMGILTAKRLKAKERLYERYIQRSGALFIHDPSLPESTEEIR